MQLTGSQIIDEPIAFSVSVETGDEAIPISNHSAIGAHSSNSLHACLAQGQVEDLWEAMCDGCDQVYENCDFGQPVLVPECVSLSDAGIEHASSTGGITTIEGLEIHQGYWRATSTSAHVLECYNSDACRGGMTGSVGYCSEGYGGPCKWINDKLLLRVFLFQYLRYEA